MRRPRQQTIRTLMVLLIVSAGAAVVGGYSIDWYTVDGGGEMSSSGGSYQLSGTIGQPDASTTAMIGGGFKLTGGFWAAALPLPGDCDGDGDVDLQDFLAFQTCYTGPGGTIEPGCGCADFDDDGDVDLTDFLAFQTAYTGPG